MIRRKKAPELIFVVLIFVTAAPGAGSIRCAHLTYINHTPRVNHTPSDPPAFVHQDRGAPQLADVFIAIRHGEVSIESCVRGYHIYSDIWEASVGEQLPCERELPKRETVPILSLSLSKGAEWLSGTYQGRSHHQRLS